MTKEIIFLMLLVSIQTSQGMIILDNNQTKKQAPVYLGKKDPLFLAIKGRAITDLVMSVKKADPAYEENKLKMAKMKLWPVEKQDQYNDIFLQSLRDYTDQTHFDFGTFMLIFNDFGNTNLKKFENESDFRVQWLGTNKYAAEFWDDGLFANSEANALLYAQKLANSPLAKKNPGSRLGDVKTIKETYANARKDITNGKQKRYTQVMALLYTKEKDGSILFHDPGQKMHDFKF